MLRVPAVLSAFAVAAVLLTGVPGTASAGVGKLAREIAEQLIKASRKVGREAAEDLASRIQRVLVRHGEDAADAIRKGGIEALELLEKGGPHAPTRARILARYGNRAIGIARDTHAVKLIARHGDELANLYLKHGRAVVTPLVTRYGDDGVRVLASLSPKQARRWAIMHRTGQWDKIPKTQDQAKQLLEILAEYGDRAMDFIWRHKGALAVTALLATFLMEPEPYINGVKELVVRPVEKGIETVGNTTGTVLTETTRSIPWHIAVPILGVCLLCYGLVKLWLDHRRRMAELAAGQPKEVGEKAARPAKATAPRRPRQAAGKEPVSQ